MGIRNLLYLRLLLLLLLLLRFLLLLLLLFLLLLPFLVVVDRFDTALFSALEQTHCARM